MGVVKHDSKTKAALELFYQGDYKQAFRIFKTFRLNFTKEEKRKIEIAYDSMTGKAAFYQSLGIDTSSVIRQSIDMIADKYGIINK